MFLSLVSTHSTSYMTIVKPYSTVVMDLTFLVIIGFYTELGEWWELGRRPFINRAQSSIFLIVKFKLFVGQQATSVPKSDEMNLRSTEANAQLH